MKLLLVHPPQKNFYMSTVRSLIPAEEGGIYPPLGLLSVATPVALRGKHEVKVLDCIAEGLSHEQVEKYIAREKPGLVGITCITEYLRDTLLVARSVKRASPETKVIVGGHHLCLFPVETIRLEEIDYGVVGDADLVIEEILDRLSGNRSLDDMPGVITKTNYGLGMPKRLIVDSLDGLPIIKRDLVDHKKYTSVLAKSNPITTMLTARGCPFNCPYCSGGGIKPRTNSIKRIADEIESCLELGIHDILFFDELFTMNKAKVFGICDEIAGRGLKLRWHARARIDSVDRQMLQKMKKSGCRLLQFGIETGSDRIQKILERKLTTEKIREVIKMTKEEGILTYGNFMFNAPTETKEEMQRTIEFSKELGLDYAAFGVLSIFYKTDFFQQLIREGKIKEDFWQRFAENPLSYEIKSVFWPGQYSDDEMNRMVEKAYNDFYVRPGYFLKALLRDESLGQKLLQIRSGLNVAARFLKLK